jgi:hypothetical protein
MHARTSGSFSSFSRRNEHSREDSALLRNVVRTDNFGALVWRRAFRLSSINRGGNSSVGRSESGELGVHGMLAVATKRKRPLRDCMLSPTCFNGNP